MTTVFQNKVLAALRDVYEEEYAIRLRVYPVRKRRVGAAYHAHIVRALKALVAAGLVEESVIQDTVRWRKRHD